VRARFRQAAKICLGNGQPDVRPGVARIETDRFLEFTAGIGESTGEVEARAKLRVGGGKIGPGCERSPGKRFGQTWLLQLHRRAGQQPGTGRDEARCGGHAGHSRPRRRRPQHPAVGCRFASGARSMSIAQRLKELGIELPPVAVPAAAYVPFVRTGDLVFVSGHIAKRDGKPYAGQLGRTLDTAAGQAAARAVAIDLLGTLQAAVGDLERVRRIVKLMSLVNSTADYTEHHLVTNGASELMVQVFGPERGAHARSAFGVAQLPLGACVEIELIAEVS